jgi:hypothetical protein
MKTGGYFNLRGKIAIIAVIVLVFTVVTFVSYERHDYEEDLKLIKSGDLVMCTAEKVGAGEGKTVLHVVEAMSVMENAIETRQLHGFILNNDAVVNGVVGYEELHQNCEGEVIFAEAGSKEERDITSGITTKGLPLEIMYSPPTPLRSF